MKPQRLRSIALAEWRGLPERPLVPSLPDVVGGTVAKVMAAWGLKDRFRQEEVLGAWQGIVGDYLAKHSIPHRLKDGVLEVRVLQPTLRYEFDRNLKPGILAKLKSRFGARVVREIKFRMG